MIKPLIFLSAMAVLTTACKQQSEDKTAEVPSGDHYALLGYASKEAWGEHLVTIMVCDDCHSPKIMTELGPMPDPALRLSGHPASSAAAQLDRQILELNGYGACNPHMTAWSGPWGISYAANLTSDPTGIGAWSEEHFTRAIREGKYKGMKEGRMLLPPMPWPQYMHMTDQELSAIFAYLKTLPAISNVVPAPEPPVTAMK
jgi:hypothetical protein